MTDTRAIAPAAAGEGLAGFFAEAVASLWTRRLLLPAAALVLLLTATNIVLALHIPAPGDPVPWQFAAAGLLRLLGLFVAAVAVLRLLNGSPRPAWRPDGSTALYGATILFGLGVTLAAMRLIGDRSDAVTGLLIGAAVSATTAPLAAWFTAIAVERPLAWRPARWLRGFGRWLPHLVFWSLLVVVPLGQLHAGIDTFLVAGAGRWFWPLALLDGPLSALLALLGLALAGTAYRRVARG